MSSNRFGWRALGATLLAALLVNTSASAATIFSDDFENDTINSNPVNPDIGLPWDNEKSPGVTVVANPDATGNASAQVLQLHNKGEMDGNLSTGILFDGATLSTNFYIGSAVAGNKITIKFRRADGTGPFNLNLKQNGDVTGGSSVGTLGITHYGTDVWQSATWSFNYNGTSSLWDVDLSFTNLATSDTKSDTFNNLALAVTTSDVFTEVTPKGQAGGSMYVDNIQVVAIPEPGSAALAMIGLIGLGLFGPRRRE